MVNVPQISLLGAQGIDSNNAINFFNALPQQTTTLAGEISKGLSAATAAEQAKATAEIAAQGREKDNQLKDLRIEEAEAEALKREEREIFESLYSQADANGKADLLMQNGPQVLNPSEHKKWAVTLAQDPSLDPSKASDLISTTTAKAVNEWFVNSENYKAEESRVMQSLTIDPTTIKDWTLGRETNRNGNSEVVLNITQANGETIRVTQSNIGAENLKKLQEISQFKNNFTTQLEPEVNASNRVVKTKQQLDADYKEVVKAMRDAQTGGSPADRDARSVHGNELMAKFKQSLADFRAAGNEYTKITAPDLLAKDQMTEVATGQREPARAASEAIVVKTNSPRVNIRTGPSKDSPKMMEVAEGNKFAIAGESGDYYKIFTPNGVTGYIHKSTVVPLDAEALEATSSDKYSKQQFFLLFPKLTEQDYLNHLATEEIKKPNVKIVE